MITSFSFKQSIKTISKKPKRKGNGFLTTNDVGTYSNINIQDAEIDNLVTASLYDIRLTSPGMSVNNSYFNDYFGQISSERNLFVVKFYFREHTFKINATGPLA